MCGGGRPSKPRVVYQGPSTADMQRQSQALDAYRQQAEAQQRQLASALQQQIDAANKAMAEQQAKLQEEQAAAAVDAANRMQGAYAVSTATQAPPAAAQTTEPIKPRAKRSRSGLTIAAGSTANTAGTGLNIGV